MNYETSRRNFLRNGAMAATAISCAGAISAAAQSYAMEGQATSIKLGLASYTFRNFTRAQMIRYMKQLNLTALNAKDVKDHLPMDPPQEATALADYAAAGIQLHALGALYFPKDEDDDVRSKFEYCKRAGVQVIVAGDPTPETLPRIEKFVKEYDIRFAIHNHGPEDKIWHSPLDVLKAVGTMDPRMGCCIDVGHCMRAGVDPVDAVHAVGEGLMPVRSIFEALVATKYKGFVDLEYEINADDPMPGVIYSFAYMRGVLAGMGYQKQA